MIYRRLSTKQLNRRAAHAYVQSLIRKYEQIKQERKADQERAK